MAKRRGIDELKERVGTFDAPIGAVQLPETGVRYDKRGNPKPLQSGQDEHEDPLPGERRARKPKEPELAFTTDLFVQDPEERAVLTACHKALAGRQVTEHELRSKLVKGGHEPDVIEVGVAKCIAAGLIDDRRYVEAFVESRVRRGHGAQRIRQDLQRRGVDRVLVDEFLVEPKESGAFDDAALEAARRKAARLDLADAKSRAKLTRWLMARGYASGQAYEAVRVIQREHADSAE